MLLLLAGAASSGDACCCCCCCWYALPLVATVSGLRVAGRGAPRLLLLLLLPWQGVRGQGGEADTHPWLTRQPAVVRGFMLTGLGDQMHVLCWCKLAQCAAIHNTAAGCGVCCRVDGASASFAQLTQTTLPRTSLVVFTTPTSK